MVSKDDVQKLANLARIDISDDEADRLMGDLESILAYVSEIQDVAAGEVEPQMSALRNVMREDADPHAPGMFTEDLLNEVPQREGDYVKVKKIL